MAGLTKKNSNDKRLKDTKNKTSYQCNLYFLFNFVLYFPKRSLVTKRTKTASISIYV